MTIFTDNNAQLNECTYRVTATLADGRTRVQYATIPALAPDSIEGRIDLLVQNGLTLDVYLTVLGSFSNYDTQILLDDTVILTETFLNNEHPVRTINVTPGDRVIKLQAREDGSADAYILLDTKNFTVLEPPQFTITWNGKKAEYGATNSATLTYPLTVVVSLLKDSTEVASQTVTFADETAFLAEFTDWTASIIANGDGNYKAKIYHTPTKATAETAEIFLEAETPLPTSRFINLPSALSDLSSIYLEWNSNVVGTNWNVTVTGGNGVILFNQTLSGTLTSVTANYSRDLYNNEIVKFDLSQTVDSVVYSAPQEERLVQIANQPATGNVIQTPPTPMASTEITYDASNITDLDGNIDAYSWNFSDGAAANGAIVNHSYGSKGTKTITLTTTDSEGGETEFTFNSFVDPDCEGSVQSFSEVSDGKLRVKYIVDSKGTNKTVDVSVKMPNNAANDALTNGALADGIYVHTIYIYPEGEPPFDITPELWGRLQTPSTNPLPPYILLDTSAQTLNVVNNSSGTIDSITRLNSTEIKVYITPSTTFSGDSSVTFELFVNGVNKLGGSASAGVQQNYTIQAQPGDTIELKTRGRYASYNYKVADTAIAP